MVVLTLTKSLASLCRLFSLALHTRFLVVLAAASFSEDAILLNLAIETLQSCFECFVFADFDFRHQGIPPLVACFGGVLADSFLHSPHGPAPKL
jgi:hypothetical protein